MRETLVRIALGVPRLLIAAALFALFAVAAGIIRRQTHRTLERLDQLHWTVRLLVARSAYVATLVLGAVVALSAVDINVSSLLTSLGLAGFALGFALKDIIENFIAGVLLLFARPFEIGDQVVLGAYEGTVSAIQLRTTTLRAYNNDDVTIPNSTVYTNPVVNHSRAGQRVYSVEFSTSLRADSSLVQREALHAAANTPGCDPEPPAILRMTRIDAAADLLTYTLFYWAAPTKAAETGTRSALTEQLKAQLYDRGIPLPQSPAMALALAPPVPPDRVEEPVPSPPLSPGTQPEPVPAVHDHPSPNPDHLEQHSAAP